MISGLQHFSVCRRQWALIHIEQQWAENYRTVDGTLRHDNAHNKSFHESRCNVLITRGMNVFSRKLGVTGECDVLELHKDANGISLKGRDGLWQPYPVEYKRGAVCERLGDRLQLCVQAMCLEEMLLCSIPEGALYYSESRRRIAIPLTNELREQVRTQLAEMHELLKRGYTPHAKPSKSCNACSLKELCLPRLLRKASVADYLSATLEDAR